MCYTRRRCHVAVKKVKRLAATAKAQQLLEASEAGDIALVKELKKSLGGKATKQGVPDSLEGKVTHESILEMFRDCYSDLYSSAATVEAMVNIKNKLQDLITDNSLREVEKVTGGLVKQACTRMKAGKMDVTGSYSSDVFLHAPDVLFELLAGGFRSYLVKERMRASAKGGQKVSYCYCD